MCTFRDVNGSDTTYTSCLLILPHTYICTTRHMYIPGHSWARHHLHLTPANCVTYIYSTQHEYIVCTFQAINGQDTTSTRRLLIKSHTYIYTTRKFTYVHSRPLMGKTPPPPDAASVSRTNMSAQANLLGSGGGVCLCACMGVCESVCCYNNIYIYE